MHHHIRNRKHKAKVNHIYEKKSKKGLIAVCLLVIMMSAAGTAYFFGFIPVALAVKEPVGNYVEMDASSYIQEYPELNEIPNLEKVKYEVFGTDAPRESIKNSYAQQLEGERYSLYREGFINIDGENFEFLAYLKGITAVVIIISEDGELLNQDTLVLYTTGNALDYQEILDWYNAH